MLDQYCKSSTMTSLHVQLWQRTLARCLGKDTHFSTPKLGVQNINSFSINNHMNEYIIKHELQNNVYIAISYSFRREMYLEATNY